ncbi:arginine--tRNA ligase [Bradymonas sediminis]|uniref:arginine--tRNA ligase n=1 Tax=Bradymonas sediminis TaxID=1548548 RepID=UPI00105F751A|nr:arginine--tRNA ligase [Bradymonas sediminis]
MKAYIMRIQDIDAKINSLKSQALRALDVPEELIAAVNLETPPQPEMGDRGIPCFSLARHFRKAPPMIAEDLVESLRTVIEGSLKDTPLGQLIAEVRPVGPYANLFFDRAALAELVLSEALDDQKFGADTTASPEHWAFEYSAPNTNKPQHLGHVRNDLLGYSVAQITRWAGHKVTRVNLINDRGIHICKSMLAYQKWGDGETPESSGIKGDHLVGKYYVRFSQELAKEYAAWLESPASDARFETWQAEHPVDPKAKTQPTPEERRAQFASAYKDAYFNQDSALGGDARAMLLRWEAGDADTMALWKMMNAWVFKGFDETYERLGIEFDHTYYESQTYKFGKDIVLDALKEGLLEQLEDGAIVADLEKLGLSGQAQAKKVLLRSDGTSVYMTQDIGTALKRFETYNLDNMVYVVGNEQEYHFQVLFKVLALLKPELAGRLYHLSYGMVELPEGKMKSREGKVVDADDLMDQMEALANEAVQERWPELSPEDLKERARIIGMAALKFYILDFNPRTTVSFDPKKSIDFQGRTGPYCLYSYARIQSIGRKMGGWPAHTGEARDACLRALQTDLEFALIRHLQDWPTLAARSAADLDPSKISEYLFRLCKSFSTLYNDDAHKIVDIEDAQRRDALLYLAQAVAQTLQKGLNLLGIETLEEM